MSKPRDRSRVKYADYCRQIGKPLHITDAEHAELHRHLSRLYNRGMSLAMIAEAAPIDTSDTAVGKILNGVVERSHRDTYNGLMKASFVPPVGLRTGRKMDPTGMRRRIQALIAAGFGYTVLAPLAGVTLQAVYQSAVADREVMSSTYARYVQLYDRLECADPMDHGATQVMVSRARGAARRRGFAPPHCWDPDTIDDPAAFPEWTGMCGTADGYRIHRREGIPVCPPCQATQKEPAKVTRAGFNGNRLRELRQAKGFSRRELSIRLNLNESTIFYWESGRSEPRRSKIEPMLSVLDAAFEDVYESEST